MHATSVITIIALVLISVLFDGVNSQNPENCVRNYDSAPGKCVPAENCPQQVEDTRISGIRPHICKFVDGNPILCCPHENIQQGSVSRVNIAGKRISVQKCEEYGRLAVKILTVIPLVVNPTAINIEASDCDFSTPLIVGGEEAKLGEFPHMAAIGWKDNPNGETSFKCGGTVISDRFIVTAGHCLSTADNAPVTVRLGDHNLQSNEDNTSPQDYDIGEIILHPEYTRLRRYNDIGLIKLRQRIKFNKFVRPACLWQSDRINSSKAIATGWGRVEYSGPTSDVLLKVELNVIGNNECRRYVEPDRRRLSNGVVESQMCAGVLEGGRDTCQGDSGGPLQITTGNDCVFHIVGLTSFGKFCAGVNSPGVYTRISSYLDWIESVVWP